MSIFLRGDSVAEFSARRDDWLMRVRLAVALALLLAPSTAMADVRFQALCSPLTGCTFTNLGDEAGSACARVEWRNRLTNASASSGTVCSGIVQANSTTQAIPMGVTEELMRVCQGADESTCDRRLVVENVQRSGMDPSTRNILIAAIAFATVSAAGWAFRRAQKR